MDQKQFKEMLDAQEKRHAEQLKVQQEQLKAQQDASAAQLEAQKEQLKLQQETSAAQLKALMDLCWSTTDESGKKMGTFAKTTYIP